jgi:hypothetical protein
VAGRCGAGGVDDVSAVPDVALRAGGVRGAGREDDIGAAGRRGQARNVVEVGSNDLGAEVGEGSCWGRIRISGGGPDLVAMVEERRRELAQAAGRTINKDSQPAHGFTIPL